MFTRTLGCALLLSLLALGPLAAQNAGPKGPEVASGLAHPVPLTVSSALSGNLVYYPIRPCRIYDTRAGSGLPGAGTGPLVHDATVPIQVTDIGTMQACGLPFPEAKAVMLNFIAVAPSGAGDLRAWPWDSTNTTPPNSSVLNYTHVTGLNLANGIILPLCDITVSTGGSCFFDAFLLPDVGNTHVVIDALGYFAAPQLPILTCTTASHDTSVPASSFANLVSGTCPVGSTAVSGGILVHGAGVADAGEVAFDASTWQCSAWNSTGASVIVSCVANCCRSAPPPIL